MPVRKMGGAQMNCSGMKGVEPIGVHACDIPFRIFQTHGIEIASAGCGCDVGEVRGLTAQVRQGEGLGWKVIVGEFREFARTGGGGGGRGGVWLNGAVNVVPGSAWVL